MLAILLLLLMIGAITYTMTAAVNDGTQTISKTVTLTGSDTRIDEAIPASQTNLLVNFALDISKCVGFYMVSDVAMTVKTNSSGSPQETFTLTADEPVFWNDAMSMTISSLFAGDVTALYVTNTTAGTLRIRAIYDPT